MNDDQLPQLLQAAEPASAEPPRMFAPDALLALARGRRFRRRAARTAAAAGLIVLVAAPLFTSDWSRTEPVRLTHQPTIAHAPVTPHVPAPDVESLQRELAQLEREAAMHEQVIAAVLAPEPPNADAMSDRLGDAELVHIETARSAALSLHYAVLAERELHDLESARREYQRVAKRFPGTQWSEYAVVSLRRLEQPSTDPSAL